MGAGRRLIEMIVGRPVTLPAELLRLYPELASACYRSGGLPPRIGGWALGTATVAGITLWRTIFLAPGRAWSAELLLHELRHVQQFASDRAFPVRYLWESVRRGYRGNRYEIDARDWARRRVDRPSMPSPSSQDL